MDSSLDVMMGKWRVHVLILSTLLILGTISQTSGSCNERCSYCEGTKCRECFYGWYGQHCSNKCSENCWHGGCERNTGSCYQCVPGRHSYDCTQPCSHHCRENSNGQVNCDQMTGNCLEDCVEGRWGPRCQYNCNANCKEKLCYKEDGGCLRGCVDGFQGFMCTDQCSKGCLNSTCHWLNRKCTHGCKKGFLGSTCLYPMTRHCLNQGYYAEHHNMACTDGCEDGYTSDRCNETCNTGCRKCHQYSKTCLSCISGFYGNKCQLECNMNCQELNCDMLGRCDKGCKPGFHGVFCNDTCPYNCLTCSQHNKTCTVCKVGYTGPECTVVDTYSVLDTTDTMSHNEAGFLVTLLICAVALIRYPGG